MDGVRKNSRLAWWVGLLTLLGIGCSGTSGQSGGSQPCGGGASQGSAAGGGSAAPGSGAGTGPGTSVPPVMTGEAGSPFIDPTPGALARLTNVEYSQTVADLLGEPPDASIRYRFPEDPRQHGFDNNVDLLHVSTAHSDRYAAAAEAISPATLP